ncbi:NAD(P)H-quinone oxidoreductase [Longimonas halophila]|nr:NAD(P)H-quinone oxidoreductase [Longimonas halophila]
MPTMRAVVVDTPGDPDQLTIRDIERPEPKPHEVRIRVQATALNRADTYQRRGHYPPPDGAPDTLGLEAAGIIDAVGADVTDWAPGDRVCALLPGGGYAEHAVVHAGHVFPVPKDIDWVQAAAFPEVFLTAYQALQWLADLQDGETVLIHAGASGVGTAATQLARLQDATVLATASAPKHDICREAGAQHVIDYESEDFAERVPALTEHGADVVIDFVGASYFNRNIEVMATDGRLVQLATMGGSTVQEVSLRALMAKRIHVYASTLRSRSDAYKTQLVRAARAVLSSHWAAGRIAPVIDSVVDWTRVAEAHRRMEANANAGKIVLRVDA